MRLSTLLIAALTFLSLLSAVAATFAFASTVVDCDDGTCPHHWTTLYSTLLFAAMSAAAAALIWHLR